MNKRHKILFGLLILSLVLLYGCGGDNGGQPAEPDPETDSVSESQEASPSEEPSSEEETEPIYITFEGTDLEGNPVSQEIFSQSQLTMVNIWATYCNPCLSEMPELGELAGEYDPADFQLIGIISDVQEGGDEAQIALAASLIEQTGADYTHLLLNRSLYSSLLTGVNAVPTTFFLDENGTLLGTVIGARDKSAWEEIINGLLEN